MQLTRISRLITVAYLRTIFLLGMACGQAKSRSTDIFYFLYVCRNLNFGWFISLFDSTPVHFSPTFRSEGMDPYWKLLVRALESLRCWRYSTWLFRCTRGLPQFIIRFGFAWLGFSSHWIITMIHFLSSVCVCARASNMKIKLGQGSMQRKVCKVECKV